jgi:hypothetical protein
VSESCAAPGKEVSILIRSEYGSAENITDLKNNVHDKKSWTNHAGDWKTYAAAAGATLAMATNASADIVYSGPVDITVSIPSTVSNHSSKPFTVNKYNEVLAIENFSSGSGRKVAQAALFGSLGLAATFPFFVTPVLYRYNAGQNISGSGLVPFGYLRGAAGPGGVVTVTIGSFGPGSASGFVGFELPDGDLGWMQVKVSVDSDGFPNDAEVIDYAYNSVPGAPIAAGQTVVATPEPGAAALGLLTIGAAGLIAWRRRRAEVASK